MPALLIPDLDDATFTRLDAQAARNGRSVADEAKAILAAVPPASAGPWERINRRREVIAATRTQTTDSVELLREDRDR